jgi:hypothetical protein
MRAVTSEEAVRSGALAFKIFRDESIGNLCNRDTLVFSVLDRESGCSGGEKFTEADKRQKFEHTGRSNGLKSSHQYLNR